MGTMESLGCTAKRKEYNLRALAHEVSRREASKPTQLRSSEKDLQGLSKHILILCRFTSTLWGTALAALATSPIKYKNSFGC